MTTIIALVYLFVVVGLPALGVVAIGYALWSNANVKESSFLG